MGGKEQEREEHSISYCPTSHSLHNNSLLVQLDLQLRHRRFRLLERIHVDAPVSEMLLQVTISDLGGGSVSERTEHGR